MQKESKENKVVLTPEQMELVREGLESYEAGDSFTSEEVIEYARQRVKGWLPETSQIA